MAVQLKAGGKRKKREAVAICRLQTELGNLDSSPPPFPALCQQIKYGRLRGEESSGNPIKRTVGTLNQRSMTIPLPMRDKKPPAADLSYKTEISSLMDFNSPDASLDKDSSLTRWSEEAPVNVIASPDKHT
ncbi:unnamed protein product [Pleuronectes platessa]|uniref:Uncharacterized protein n=1 Tax=Pleuronectes platessa TaxID=8262 RepID=A0A9N7YS75_PLEPL|nr:unnamed protein product [Pleuronectes platessa]